MAMKKISFCTVCMNRLSYLRQTLPVNLTQNASDPDVEFILLDYNSKDDLENWVRTELEGYIATGKLKYFKTFEPEYFSMAHSKNLALKLAKGDILGMIDADNYTGTGYAQWIRQCFETFGPQTIVTTLRKDLVPIPDAAGKMCFSRRLFHQVNGVDESLIGYGTEDIDLVNRMESNGGKRVFIENPDHLMFIQHGLQERHINYRYSNLLETIYFRSPQPNPDIACVIYLFKDNSLAELTYEYKEELKMDIVRSVAGWTIEREDQRRTGRFHRQDGLLNLLFDDGSRIAYKECATAPEQGLCNSSGSLEWLQLTREQYLFDLVVIAYGDCQNKLKSAENARNLHSINPSGWGRSSVFLNFDMNNPILVS
jgi:GT2 family glycosyltransferase